LYTLGRGDPEKLMGSTNMPPRFTSWAPR